MSPGPAIRCAATGLLLGLAACAAPAPPQVRAAPDGAVITAAAPFSRVEVYDPDGVPVERRTLPAPVTTLALTLPAGRYTLTVDGAPLAVEVPDAAPVRAEVQVAPGAPWAPLGGEVEVPTMGAATVRIAVIAGPGAPPTVETSLGPISLGFPGQRVERSLALTGPTVVTVGAVRSTLRPVPVDPGALRVGAPHFPVLPDGTEDLGRPVGVLPLPDPWWDAAVRRIGAGTRRRDPDAPLTWLGVPLDNTGDRPLDVLVALHFDEPAFHPRLRDADGGTGAVQTLVRVPAHTQLTTALPIFVDADTVSVGAHPAALTITALGATTPLSTQTTTLPVVRGDRVANLGFVAALLVATVGFGWLTRRLPGWLRDSPTSELMTIALFGSALFVTGTASDLVAMAVGALLGPFSTLLTGLLGDLTRVALLGTLLGLRPRPGTLALSTLTGYLLRGLALGSFAVTDVVYLGVAIAVQETMAWVVGASRGRVPGFGALALCFGVSSVVTTLVGLWLHIVLYRLYYAPWYVALQVLGPGLCYHTIAAAVAARSIAALRQVQA